jgi:hypothetical protein
MDIVDLLGEELTGMDRMDRIGNKKSVIAHVWW